ncbi:LacI family DNA-binding transcriptional regulator [Oricola sp.]|uniref:LacI family DNA-binding transcriptional regulator n=1 Tax=Oricola sp. TaxID=1979950 RepID=UPI003BAAA39A
MNLKKLSSLLGLSQTTVSRALNGYPEVSEATRQRVAEFAREMNYQPNRSAQRLATGKSLTIGHVVPVADHDMMNPHFIDFIAGAGEIYHRRGYDMLISVVSEDEQNRFYESLHRNKRVDGVIVHGPTVDDERVRLLNALGLPFVVHGRTKDPEESYSWVDVNNEEVFEKAAEYLLSLGHRRIGLINGWEFMTFAERRRAGYERALRKNGIKPVPELMYSNEMIEPNGHAAMLALLDLRDTPTAVLCSSVLTAMGAIRALRDRGLRPGDDVSMIGFDDCLSFLPSTGDGGLLTAYRSGIRLAGRQCADMLIDQIEGGGDNASLLLNAELSVGKSTRPLECATAAL